MTNLPATAKALDGQDLTPYEGRYLAQRIDDKGTVEDVVVELTRHNGRLRGVQTFRSSSGAGQVTSEEEDSDAVQTGELGLAFYRADFALDLGPEGKPVGTRSDFVPGPDGKVAWWRNHGRLYRHQAP